MARLNDPPVAPGPSSETVDAVKRRFLRQNRELAKINSQQSVRIRNLETEGARLLAENLNLREQVIHLQHALETQSTRPSLENIGAVKDKLEAKIQEFAGLVAELGQMKATGEEAPCKVQTAVKRGPEERQWRSGLCLQEVENNMLPTIAEGKFYPRKTMNAEELREILQGEESQSPDLGPPPVARFENEEPIKFDPEPGPVEEPVDEEPEATPALSINLETRRKRRESNPKITIRRLPVFQSPPETEVSEDAAGKTIRAGAKRKLSVREDEAKAAPEDSPSEAFRFNRIHAQPVAETEPPAKPEIILERPVLGNKPVNTDPVLSPKKQRPSTLSKLDPKKPSSRSKGSRFADSRRPVLDTLEIPNPPIQTTDIHLDSLNPKTPAAEDNFTPPSTEPSTSRPESKDTPPPSDLAHSANPENTTARPSRRARAAVNYAEPNLVTKMRRPTKDLVDAVLPPTSSRRASADPAPPTVKKPGSNSVKREHDGAEDEAWKNLPIASTEAGDAAETQSPLRDKLGRRDQLGLSKTPMLNSSAAAEAISALISAGAGGRRKSAIGFDERDEEKGGKNGGGNITLSSSTAVSRDEPDPDLAIFDIQDSSSPPQETGSTITAKSRESSKLKGRRHSSVASGSSESRGHARNGGLGRSGSGKDKDKERRERRRREERIGNDEGDGGIGDGKERAERAAGRRRSMLL